MASIVETRTIGDGRTAEPVGMSKPVSVSVVAVVSAIENGITATWLRRLVSTMMSCTWPGTTSVTTTKWPPGP